MGTSTNYEAPPSWGPLKSDATRAASGAVTPQVARELVQGFIRQNGGVGSLARGGTGGGGPGGGTRSSSGGTGRGGSVATGRGARATAARLGAFMADVRSGGLSDALRRAGWGDLVGRPVHEFLACLLDRLGGDASSIDDVDARMALGRLEQQYFADVGTPEELEQRLNAQVDRVGPLLQDFFGHYLYEVFCRVFYERLVQRVGETRAESLLGQIRNFIAAALANRATATDLSQVDWRGPEGETVVSDIMEATLNVFG